MSPLDPQSEIPRYTENGMVDFKVVAVFALPESAQGLHPNRRRQMAAMNITVIQEFIAVAI
jgi:hypothetical protein